MKNLVIIGAGGSIARELAKHLHNEYTIYGISYEDVDKDYVAYYTSIVSGIDVTNTKKYEETCKNITTNLNRLDGIVFASGVTIPGDIKTITEEQWDRSIDINLKGYWLTFKNFYDILIKSPGCSIVQINSKTGKKGSYKNSAYTASKFGGIGLTQSMALELVEFGVRVNCVCPGNVFESKTWSDSSHGLFLEYAKTQNLTPDKVREKYTNLVPMKRSCKYQDIANVVEFLLSEKSSYMTGQAINITGGQQLV
jgi:sorbitol-6-phosphate 2-dehydrogenase